MAKKSTRMNTAQAAARRRKARLKKREAFVRRNPFANDEAELETAFRKGQPNADWTLAQAESSPYEGLPQLGEDEHRAPLYTGIPDADLTVRLWEEAHGESPEGQAYLTLATLRDQDPEAFAQGVCAGLARGSAAAICHYDMTRCSSPAAMTPGVRAMDEAFQKSPAFAEHGCGTEVETCSFLLSRDEMRLQSLSGASRPDSDRRITARSLGLTALKLACQLDFPPAFAAFAWNWTTFQSVMKLREDQKTLASEQLPWLLRGSNLDIEACTLLLGLELRKQRFIPVSAEEEEALLKKLLAIASQGNWLALHELLLILMQRPGFLNLPLTGEALGLLTDCAEREPSSAAGAFLLWSRYFGSFAPAAPEQALAEAHHILKAASARQASQKSSAQNGLPLLRCLLALHAILQGNRQQGLQELRRLEKDNLEPVAARLLAALPHADLNGTETLSALKGAFGGQADSAASRESFLADLFQDSRARQEDSLEEPDDERLHRSLALSSLCPRLLADYLWQGLVCTKDTNGQDDWFRAMATYLPPIGGQSPFLEGLLYLHGYEGEPSLHMALRSLSMAAAQHFVPALDLLADITGRGLRGCTPGVCEALDDEDWVEEGCRHLAPRALAVYGLLHGHKDPEATLPLPGRSGSFTLRELLEWCGRQDADCLCQACHALFLLEERMKEGIALEQEPEGEEKARQDEDLTRRTGEAGRRLFAALALAQIMADAGTFLHAGQELLRLNEEDRASAAKDPWVLQHAASICLDRLRESERTTEAESAALPATEDDCFLVAVFCLDRAAFFGEPKAQTILKSLDKKAVTLALQDVRALNLTAPLKNLVCLTNCVLV